MIDIRLIRENPELVKENIRKKFQDQKLELVDKVAALDTEYRDAKKKGDDLRAFRNTKSKEIGMLMGQGKREEAEEAKKEVGRIGAELEALTNREKELED